MTSSGRTPWFEGPSLLEYLETVEVTRNTPALPFRFPVQLVARPNDEFRGYAGQIASGTVRVGDTVHAWPSGRTARVKRIVTYDGDLDLAYSPMSVTLTLDDEIDISRGDMITTEPPMVSQRFEAEMVWMDERPLDPARVYLLKHASKTVTAEINHGLLLNQIGTVTVSTARPLVFDRYDVNRGTGSFIIIDPATHFTAGAGMIVNAAREGAARGSPPRRSAPPNGWRCSPGARGRTRRPPKPFARRSRRCSRDRRPRRDCRDAARRECSLHHLELPGGVRRAHAHAARVAAGRTGALPRDVPPLRADARPTGTSCRRSGG